MENAAGTPDTKSHLLVIVTCGLCAITCGVTFLLALFRQFGLVEVAASLSAWIEVFLMSASIGDLLEGKPRPNRRRAKIALILAAGIVIYFLAMKVLIGKGA